MPSIGGRLLQCGTCRNGLAMKPIKFKLQGSLMLGQYFHMTTRLKKKIVKVRYFCIIFLKEVSLKLPVSQTHLCPWELALLISGKLDQSKKEEGKDS